jgi:hypothetical protein
MNDLTLSFLELIMKLSVNHILILTVNSSYISLDASARIFTTTKRVSGKDLFGVTSQQRPSCGLYYRGSLPDREKLLYTTGDTGG